MTATKLGNGGVYRIKVTASVGSMGLNEAAVDTRPVNGATVMLGTRVSSTNDKGLAMVKVRGGRQQLTVTAGDTLQPASVFLDGK